MKVRWVSSMAVLASLLGSATQAESFEDLVNKSIIYVFREKVVGQDGNTYDNTWSGTVYVAPTGHVFFRHRGSSRFGNNGSESRSSAFDTEGDRDGNGNGRRTNYRWDGSGFSRSWNEHGVQFTQAITIQGGACSTSIVRGSFSGTVLGQSGSCRIVSGNALKR